jgi:hypothetical protein
VATKWDEVRFRWGAAGAEHEWVVLVALFDHLVVA